MDVHPTACLIHLAEAEDVRREARNIVDPGQCAVLPILTLEDDGVVSFNLDDGAVAETNRPADGGVKFGECSPGASHVISGPGVEHPPLVLVVLPRTELGENLLLLDLDDAPRCLS